MTVDPLPTLAEWEKPDRHKWGERVTILPSESPDGCERSERMCEKCGIVKITVHPPQGNPWRE